MSSDTKRTGMTCRATQSGVGQDVTSRFRCQTPVKSENQTQKCRYIIQTTVKLSSTNRLLRRLSFNSQNLVLMVSDVIRTRYSKSSPVNYLLHKDYYTFYPCLVL